MDKTHFISQSTSLTLVITISLIFTLIGLVYSKKYQGINNYLTANRNIGFFSLSTSLIASALGAWILFGPASAATWGGIGAVIGHEISHAFDDSGARFDGDGNVNNWWTESDLEEFEKRGNALAEQYSSLEVLDGVFINGKFTLGENIGDLGGVLGAYDGLQIHIKENGRPEPIDGFSAEERFFMSWATVWRTLIREDALRSQITTDPHSPGYNRATQPLKNVDAFYEVFGVKEGDNMYIAPENRVRIW